MGYRTSEEGGVGRQSPSTEGVQEPALEEVDQPDDSRADAGEGHGAEHAGAGLGRRQAR